MELLAGSVPFIKVLVVFGFILIGIRNRLGLALSIFLGGLFMGLVFQLSLRDSIVTAATALLQEKFLFLITIVGLIMVLSDALETSGQSRRLMAALSGYLTRVRLRLIFFPALIGLLPMPGGAVFSAPMVKTVSRNMTISSEDLAVINYWFRHLWELGWPLYPGIILTVALADIPISALLSCSWPAIPAMFFIGWFFFLRGTDLVAHPVTLDASERQDRDIKVVLREGAPLLIAIFGAISLESMLAHSESAIPFEFGVVVALVAAIGCVMFQNRLGAAFLCSVLKRRNLWSMLLVIVSIFIFKDIMQAAAIVQKMAATGGGASALFAASVFLPFLVGMVAGINVAFVGATFPLLIGLLQTLGMEDELIRYLVLASFAGFAGVMISPIHICFVLTCDYFGADLLATWRRMILPCVSFLTVGVLLFAIL